MAKRNKNNGQGIMDHNTAIAMATCCKAVVQRFMINTPPLLPPSKYSLTAMLP